MAYGVLRAAACAALSLAMVMAGCALDGSGPRGNSSMDLPPDNDEVDTHPSALTLGIVLTAGGVAAARNVDAISAGNDTIKKEHRQLQSVQGRLVNGNGEPIDNATLLVRTAPKYVSDPESLPASTVFSTAGGNYSFSMTKANFVCVDFSAPGIKPERRWFVALTPKDTRNLPVDKREILFVVPEQKTTRVATMIMARAQ